MFKRLTTLLPLLLGFALLAQANASVDHTHLDHSDEVECQFHVGSNESLEGSGELVATIAHGDVLIAELEARAALAEIIRRSSRGPPTPV